MSYLTQQELQQFRNDIAPLLSGEAVIERPSLVSDGAGGYTTEWDTLDTVPARFEPYNRATPAAEEAQSEHYMATKIWFMYCPSGTDIKPIDRVTFEGSQFEVAGVREPRSDGVTTRCEVVQTDAGGF